MQSTNRTPFLLLSALFFLFIACNKEDPNSGCILSASITLTPGATNNQLQAFGHDGLEPYTYLWSNGQTTQTITGDTATDYDVTITDDLGCTSTAHASATACPSTVTDVDDNVYVVERINGHCWMVENLRTTHFADGTAIGETEDSASWAAHYTNGDELPDWCYYKGNPANDAQYGKLYNWYAIDDNRGLAPTGWHVATYNEYLELFNSIGGLTVAGGKMKATSSWFPPNTGADNSTGFTAYAGGLRWEDAHFSDMSYQAFFWTDDFASTANGRYINLFYNTASVVQDNCSKYLGFSVRCVKDY